MNLRTIRSAAGVRWRSTRARIAGSAIVLAYHRVADLPSDPQLLAVGIDRFDEQMRVLSASCNPISATELIECLIRRKRIPERSVVVTLDDGYADALTNARPILSSRCVPATVFVSSSYVGGHAEFWWDELERIVLLSETPPSRVEISSDPNPYVHTIAPGSSAHETVLAADAWNVTMPPRSERERIYLELREYLLPLSSAQRTAALAELRSQFGTDAAVRPTHRPLGADEVRQLAEDALIDIGAHTQGHVMLAARPAEEQRDEICGGKAALEQVVGRNVRLFSYPYGDHDSYTESSVRMVREAGFFGAFTTRFGIALPWTDRFRAPRCPTADIGGPEFAARLDRWFEMAR